MQRGMLHRDESKRPAARPLTDADFPAAALAALRGPDSVLLIGPAGAGKTALLRHWIATDRPRGLWAVAPTGMAAEALSKADLANGVYLAQTIHSFLHVDAYATADRMEEAAGRLRGERAEIIARLRVLVIDEISMVRADIMDGLDRFLRRARHLPHVPFGGVRLILVGDVNQLPPVVKETEELAFGAAATGPRGRRYTAVRSRYRTVWFHGAPGIRRLADDHTLRLVELDCHHRQADPAFIAALDDLAEGRLTDRVSRLLNPRAGLKPAPGSIALCARRRDVDEINDAHLKAMDGEGGVSVATHDEAYAREHKYGDDPMEPVIRWMVGEPVVMTANDRDGRWRNGTLGVIVGKEDGRPVVRLSDGTVHVILPIRYYVCRPKTVINDDGEYDIGTTSVGVFTQLPMRAAWAMTIHKAQGQTIERAHIVLGEGDVRGGGIPGLVYTAVTRVPDVDALTIDRPIRPADLSVSGPIRRFLEELRADRDRTGTHTGERKTDPGDGESGSRPDNRTA